MKNRVNLNQEFGMIWMHSSFIKELIAAKIIVFLIGKKN